MIRFNNADGYDVTCDFECLAQEKYSSKAAKNAKEAGRFARRMGWSNVFMTGRWLNACPKCARYADSHKGKGCAA